MLNYKFVSAEEAASYVNHGDILGFSGFTPAGCPKEVPTAIAKRADSFPFCFFLLVLFVLLS